MSSLNEIVSIIINKYESENDWKYVKKIIYENYDLLFHLTQIRNNNTNQLLDAIENSLNDAKYSVAVIYILSIHSDNIFEDSISFYYKLLSDFILNKINSIQIKFVNIELLKLITNFTDLLVNKDKSIFLIRVLLKVIVLVQPNANCLTPYHQLFLRSCILNRLYAYAVENINKFDVLEVNPNATSLVVLDYLLYFYYSGICFIGVKDYKSAIRYFSLALSTPGNLISQVALQSYKKASLLHLIQYGTEYELPKYAPNELKVYLKNDNNNYATIVKVYTKSNDIKNLEIIFDRNKYELNQDNNIGLIKQVYDSWIYHQIIKLTLAYTNISFDKIIRRLNLPTNFNIEMILYDMIKNKLIVGKIDQLNKNITFHDNVNTFVDIEQFINDNTSQTLELINKFRSLRNDVITSKAYVIRRLNNASGGMSTTEISDEIVEMDEQNM